MYSISNILKSCTFLCYFLLSACSVTQPKTVVTNNPVSTSSTVVVPSTGWRTVRFQIAWQPDQEPNWYIDTMIAGEVIAPLLTMTAGKQLKFWRVHRRAKNDVTGHMFSFIFYGNTTSAELIYAAIRNNALVAKWQREGKIKHIQLDNLQQNKQPNIEDTSDKAWPPTIQKTWPIFIMGASQMWLELIAEIKSTQKNKQTVDLSYQEIQKEITRLWESNGQHAWLHHLNALYGYSPIAIRF